MFSIEQINDVHNKFGKMTDFLSYVITLRSLGVERYHSYLTDGHSEYFGTNGYTVKSPPVHEILPIAATADRENLVHHIFLHQQRKTDYLTMSRGLADSGVERWSVDTAAATISYHDTIGNQLLTSAIT